MFSQKGWNICCAWLLSSNIPIPALHFLKYHELSSTLNCSLYRYYYNWNKGGVLRQGDNCNSALFEEITQNRLKREKGNSKTVSITSIPTHVYRHDLFQHPTLGREANGCSMARLSPMGLSRWTCKHPELIHVPRYCSLFFRMKSIGWWPILKFCMTLCW